MRRLRRLARFLGSGLSDLFGLVPALIAGAGVFLVVAGLLNYMAPVAASPDATPSLGFGPSLTPTLVSPTPQGSRSPGPSSSPSATANAGGAHATRVQVPALGIDLPVVASAPNENFPLCNVAEYFVDNGVKPPKPLLATPGAAQATYLYAHARTGMFLPLLTHSQVNNGQDMIGMYAVVYTDDNQRHIYEIDQVIRHVSASAASLDQVFAATTDQLWLQTSEGANTNPSNSSKLQVVATPLGVLAADPADAHPTGKGRVCA
ncbi:MAG TPA: hypothetical protein VIK06_03920 [Candidatus Limnocylindrales bacterium]|jgi:hypothetical protein